MSHSPKRRRAAVLPPGRATLREAAEGLGISVITLRRRIRPTGNLPMRRLWAERLDLKRRSRGNSMPVFHVCRRRLEQWGPELGGEDRSVVD